MPGVAGLHLSTFGEFATPMLLFLVCHIVTELLGRQGMRPRVFARHRLGHGIRRARYLWWFSGRVGADARI